MNDLLEATEWPRAGQGRPAWLGDAIAIKDPTCVVFRPAERQQRPDRRPERRGGAGHDDDGGDRASPRSTRRSVPRRAGSTCSTAARSTRPWPGKLGQLADVLPHPVTNVTWRDLGATFTDLAAEIKRRQEMPRRGSRPDLHLHLRHPAVPRPPQVGRRLRVLAVRRGQAGAAVEALRRHSPRRPAGGDPHDRLVRQRQQHEPDARSPGHEGIREPHPLPDELQRLEHADRHSRRRASWARTGRCTTARKRTGSRSSGPTDFPSRSGSRRSSKPSPPGPSPRFLVRPTGNESKPPRSRRSRSAVAPPRAATAMAHAGDGNRPAPLVESHAPLGDEADLADPTIEALEQTSDERPVRWNHNDCGR